MKDIDSEGNKEKDNDCKYDPHNHGTKRMMLKVFHMFVCFDNIVGLYNPSLIISDIMVSRCSGETSGMFRLTTSGSLICSSPESEEMELSE